MSPLSSLLLPLLFLLPVFANAADTTKCYNVNGTELDSTYAPCKLSSGSKHSGCCATNRSSGADVCLDSGLCMATGDKYVGTIWQNGCTDKSWKDGGCPTKMCPDVSDKFDGYDPVSSWNIQTCDYGSYCCRSASSTKNCCNDGTAPKFTTTFLGAIQLPTSTVSLSASSTKTPTTTASPTATALTTSYPSSTTFPDLTCPKDKTALVGGAVGGTLGAALVGLLGLVLWMHKKEKRQRKLKEHYEEQFAGSWALRKRLVSSAGVSMVDTSEVNTLSEKEGVVTTSDFTGHDASGGSK